MSATFRSLRHRPYRLWASGAVVSNVGTWMQRVAQDWLVLTQLTDESGTAVGITTGLQFGPILLLAPVTGAVADRWPKKRVLLVTQSAMALLGLGLGLLVVTGAAQLWHVYVFAVLLGCATAFDGPARQTFVHELVPREDLSNAVGLNSASFNSARLVGPGLAGLLIGWVGTGPLFLINALSFAGPILALWRIRPLARAPRPARGRGGMGEALRHLRHRPDVVAILAVVAVVGTVGMNFQLTTALMARVEFDRGPGEYGLLGSIIAIGSLSGALLAARRERPRMRLVFGAAAAFGVVTTVAALMPSYALFAVLLVPVGLCSLTLMTSANATIQLSTDPAIRSRVMALYMGLFQGGTVVGGPLVGWMGSAFGPRWSLLVGSLPAVAVAVAAALFLLRRGGERLHYQLRGTPHLQVLPAERTDSAAA
ncbi:MFS transporter [Kineococcus glutinatus]|uniref:MFS transporter n=1 Tax=Kineococcus glutinatus TaxID=1070872 RepID=A0ABP9HCR8_9ACTN